MLREIGLRKEAIGESTASRILNDLQSHWNTHVTTQLVEQRDGAQSERRNLGDLKCNVGFFFRDI